MPICLSVTTITTLLALQIESALDVDETQLIRSMSRNSISQTMLVLTQARSIPAIKRALPIFEELLAKHNLYRVQPDNLGLLTRKFEISDLCLMTIAQRDSLLGVICSFNV